MTPAKPFPITKRQVWEAYQRVKANQGRAGVDGQTVAEFEEELENNLYKLWNRMASGSYRPPSVKRVEIAKPGGGSRPLGIPTVADRIAQTVGKQALEPEVEAHFHPDSYGYRPGKSAHQALRQARTRCWRNDWVVDLDIKGFFATIAHARLLALVRRHTQAQWVLLYLERWLKAPEQLPDGTVQGRTRGTPQGGVVRPLRATLFLHYAFDMWMRRDYPHIPFERYADDGVCPCRTRQQAEHLQGALVRRFADWGLELHSEKTQIVYCKDADRRLEYPVTTFDFLGYTFRPRRSKTRWGKYFINFSPAISHKAAKGIRQVVRSWQLHLRSDKALEDLARMFNAKIRGWVPYYGAFYKSALYRPLRHIDRKLGLWATRKFKRLRGHKRRADQWLRRLACRQLNLFAHWRLLYGQAG